ncbi:MAG: DUF2889 domain-containing protein [Acidimicrobiales bacterium]
MFADLPPSATVDAWFDRLEAIPALNVADFGSGLCRRRIRLAKIGDGLVVGELEDDFHHFRIELEHDGVTILRATGTPLRGPWSTCMDVAEPLRAIEGEPLSSRSTAIGEYAEATRNCTHLFDLTGLAVAHASRDVDVRQYDLAMTDPVDEHNELALWRDGELLIYWKLDGPEIVAPAEWVGVPLQSKFIPWAEENLDEDVAEAAIALRRMLHISMGRGFDLDATESAAEHLDGPVGRCHTYQPEVLVGAIRSSGSVRDFTQPEDGAMLLADMSTRGDGRS